MFYIYVIKSIAKNYIYVGLTNDLERRIKQHNSGKGRATKPYLPYSLILTEKYNTRIEARTREKYLKSGCGKEYIKNFIKH